MTDEIDQTDTEMPTVGPSEYISEHRHTTDPQEAHPIDGDIIADVCETKLGPALIHDDLAVIQAVVVKEILPYNGDMERWITCYPQVDDLGLYQVENGRDRDGTLHYYQVQSGTFYDILAMVDQQYEHRIAVENVEDIVEVHTRQFLRDVHGYEGYFGNPSISDSAGEQSEPDSCGQVPNDSIDRVREPTLSNAYNDPKPGEGVVNRDNEPENAHYGFTDSRGLVVEEGTHPVDSQQYSIGLLASKLDQTPTRTDGDWTEGEAVYHLTQNYICDEQRALEAFERYQEVS